MDISLNSPTANHPNGPFTYADWYANTDTDKVLFDTKEVSDPWTEGTTHDFIATQNEAEYEFQPGSLPTSNYPIPHASRKIPTNGEKHHYCSVPSCQAKPFKRASDLKRHCTTTHRGDSGQSSNAQATQNPSMSPSMSPSMRCDYKRCSDTTPFRKDHGREHYREYHREDLIRSGSSRSNKAPDTIEKFLEARIGQQKLDWWRCARCLQRVRVDASGYTCPKCNLACESERVAYRENACKPTDATPDLGSAMGCGQCQDFWSPDKDHENLWISCPTCRPGI